AVQEGEDQSRGRLPAGAAADADLLRPVLGAAGVGGTAPRAVDGLDPGPDRARSLVHPAGDQHRGDVGHAEALADDRHGPDAAAHDADDAAGVRRDDGLLPGRPGAVLGHQRRPGPAAAVVHAAQVRRAGAGQGLTGHSEARQPAGFLVTQPMDTRRATTTDTTDTIAAIATPAGAGGVGIVRLSGPAAATIARQLCGRALQPRHAHHVRFRDADGGVIDDGIALAFVAPASYTGEDVVELQAHGSAPVLRQLLARCCALGARIARPGELSERAYPHARRGLAQAEAVADLIAAGDERAARAARRALDGEFSKRVDALAERLMGLRVHVEAAIDFADEPIETLGGNALNRGLAEARAQLDTLLVAAERGRKLRDGLHAVIVGPPNARKSALINTPSCCRIDTVTQIAGTTRDLLHETLRIDGFELNLVDTAGLREDGDAIEREGMRRARAELRRA